MARAIRTPATRDAASPVPPASLDAELAQSAEALRSLLEVIRGLDERGVLRFSADLLREEDRVVQVLTERMEPGELRRTLRNVTVLVEAFRDVDPATLRALSAGVPKALDRARAAQDEKPVGWFEVAGALRDPDVNRGVRMVLGFLRGIGEADRSER